MINTKMVWRVDPVKALTSLSTKIQNKAMRIAINAGAAPVKQAVIANAPKDVGNLKQAIKIKVVHYNTGHWCAVVGAGSKFKRLKKVKKANGKTSTVKRLNKKTGKKERVYAKPAKYQPLLVRGTKKMRARDFMDAALRTSQQQFYSVTKRKLQEVIPQLIAGSA